MQEVILGSTMWSIGLRYRKHGKDLPGTPDFYLTKSKIAVFAMVTFGTVIIGELEG